MSYLKPDALTESEWNDIRQCEYEKLGRQRDELLAALEVSVLVIEAQTDVFSRYRFGGQPKEKSHDILTGRANVVRLAKAAIVNAKGEV